MSDAKDVDDGIYLRPVRVSPREWPHEGLERLDSCPACGSSAGAELYSGLRDVVFSAAPGLWTVFECQECGSGYLDPRPTRATIGRAYVNYYTHAAAEPQTVRASIFGRTRQALRNGYLNTRYGSRFSPAWKVGSALVPLMPCARQWADRRMRHLHGRIQGRRLLDVGCGNGAFLLDMLSAGWLVQGLDPDPAAIAAARTAGLSADVGVIESADLRTGEFDAVTLNHVIEHLHDPRETLRACHRVLAPDGLLWIATPNFASLSHRTFRSDWRGLEIPRHLLLFTARPLERLVSECGFNVVSWKRYCGARAVFSASAALAQSQATGQRRGPRLTTIRALGADARSFLRPRSGEELILIAQKS